MRFVVEEAPGVYSDSVVFPRVVCQINLLSSFILYIIKGEKSNFLISWMNKLIVPLELAVLISVCQTRCKLPNLLQGAELVLEIKCNPSPTNMPLNVAADKRGDICVVDGRNSSIQ